MSRILKTLLIFVLSACFWAEKNAWAQEESEPLLVYFVQNTNYPGKFSLNENWEYNAKVKALWNLLAKFHNDESGRARRAKLPNVTTKQQLLKDFVRFLSKPDNIDAISGRDFTVLIVLNGHGATVNGSYAYKTLDEKNVYLQDFRDAALNENFVHHTSLQKIKLVFWVLTCRTGGVGDGAANKLEENSRMRIYYASDPETNGGALNVANGKIDPIFDWLLEATSGAADAERKIALPDMEGYYDGNVTLGEITRYVEWKASKSSQKVPFANPVDLKGVSSSFWESVVPVSHSFRYLKRYDFLDKAHKNGRFIGNCLGNDPDYPSYLPVEYQYNFRGQEFNNCSLANSIFYRVDLRNATFQSGFLRGAVFKDCLLDGATCVAELSDGTRTVRQLNDPTTVRLEGYTIK